MNINFLRSATQKMGLYYRLAHLYYALFVRPKYTRFAKRMEPEINQLKALPVTAKSNLIVTLENKLKNSGGFRSAQSVDVGNIQGQILKNESRKGSGEFEGLALNDAVRVEVWQHFSFVKLARMLAKIVKQYTGKSTFSALELGCGSGSLFDFLKHLGVENYLGVDGNALAFEHSPFVKSSVDNFRLLNLQEEIDFNYKFDVVYTFEVLEHIKEEKTDFFLKTIANHLGPQSLFLGTISFSKMDVHINRHDRDWWLKAFSNAGLKEFESSAEFTALIAESHPYNWSKANTHIFALRKF